MRDIIANAGNYFLGLLVACGADEGSSDLGADHGLTMGCYFITIFITAQSENISWVREGSCLALVVELEDFPAFLLEDAHVVLGDLFLSVYYALFQQFVGEAVGQAGRVHALLC